MQGDTLAIQEAHLDATENVPMRLTLTTNSKYCILCAVPSRCTVVIAEPTPACENCTVTKQNGGEMSITGQLTQLMFP